MSAAPRWTWAGRWTCGADSAPPWPLPLASWQAREADAAQARLVLASNAGGGLYADLVRLTVTEQTLAQSLQVRTTTARLFEQRYAHGLENQGGVHSARARQAAAPRPNGCRCRSSWRCSATALLR
jgi:hypothetical protein